MPHIGALSGQIIPDTVSHYEWGRIVAKTVSDEIRILIDKAKAGVSKVLSWGSEGIDMRGKTREAVRSYFIGGTVHFLDTPTFNILEELLKKGIKITVFLKNCLEHNRWREFALEYYAKIWPVVAAKILSYKQGISRILG